MFCVCKDIKISPKRYIAQKLTQGSLEGVTYSNKTPLHASNQDTDDHTTRKPCYQFVDTKLNK